jgi:thiol:disulfide interchange protein/DsbC/DsbD-like thiol-disulfide interchange protein
VHRRYNLIPLLLLLLYGPLAALPGAGDHPVQARLLATVDAVVPGQVFNIGVELKMEEGWHTYWSFSGDAGLPIEIAWQSPDGYTAGPLQWPLPSKYEEEGGLTVYGYADEVLLAATVDGAGGLVVGDTLYLAAEVSWLVCRELCIPGDTSLALALPVAKVNRPSAHQALFDRYAARVPGALDERVELNFTVRGTRDLEVELGFTRETSTFSAGEQIPEFYPQAADDFEFSTQRIRPDRLLLSLKPYGDTTIDSLRGVLVYRANGQVEAAEVALDLRSALQAGEGGPGLLERDFNTIGDKVVRSLWVYIAFAVLGGLILNLMPCVLPVISLKILGFVNQAGEDARRVRQLGWAFCGGILATFLALALVVLLLKGGGEQIGWGFQFQYPGFVMAMAALVFALALSLFGVFEILLPGTSGEMGGLGGREGLSGSFLNGVLATILATPCTAPFLGTALGFAFAQSPFVVVVVFAAIGIGMALPYMVLALKPAWMGWLPKPGPWMGWFKQLMGFLLMATVLWLLWVLGNQVGVEGVVWTGAFLLGLALACWVWGQWGSFLHAGRSQKIARVTAFVLVAGSYGLFLHPLLAVEQEMAAVDGNLADELDWRPFSIGGVEELVANGQMVFIDFTAEWCWTCKVNERVVLSQEAVRQRFTELDVALVKADWTNRNAEITQLLRAFGRSGVPLYVIFPAGRPDSPLILPEVITAELVLKKLEEAAAIAGEISR